MGSRRFHTFVRKTQLGLTIVSALYLAAIVSTAIAVNHSHALRLEQHSISRLWLPANYLPDAGYQVPLNLVVRDLNSGIIFSATGRRTLDVVALLWVLTLLARAADAVARRRRRGPRVSWAHPSNTVSRQPLRKAAPYGAGRRSSVRGKVLPFRRA